MKSGRVIQKNHSGVKNENNKQNLDCLNKIDSEYKYQVLNCEPNQSQNLLRTIKNKENKHRNINSVYFFYKFTNYFFNCLILV